MLADAGGGPGDPIPGDPYQLESLASQLGTLAQGLQDAVTVLASVEAGQWRGPAAEAFHSVMHQQPGHYAAAGAAFSEASAAIAAYAQVLAEAQATAMRAQSLAEDGQIATSNWRNLAEAAGKAPKGTDPGAADTALAAQMAGTARSALPEAQTGLIAALRAAEAGAPSAPSLFDRITGDVWQAFTAPVDFGWNVVVGFGKGTWGMATGLFNLAKILEAETNPLYRLVDPGGWRAANAEVAGIGSAVWNHPGEFFKDLGENLVDWKQWTTNPGQAIGELVPGILLAVATSGTGAAADSLGEAGEAAAAGAKSLDALSSALGASGESTLSGARALSGINAAVEEQLPAGDLRALVTLSNLTDETAMYDSAAAQLAASDHLAATASTLRGAAEALEQAKKPLETIHTGLERLNSLNTVTGVGNAVVGTGEQVNGAAGDPGGQHLLDGAGAGVPVNHSVEHSVKEAPVHVSTPEGDVGFTPGGK